MIRTCLLLIAFVASFPLHAEKVIHLTPEQCLFVQCPVPKKGIVCSNYDRAKRLSAHLEKAHDTCAWGPFVAKRTYQGEEIFIACAPVGKRSK